MKSKFLKLNKACSENWENMEPNELGNYCNLCAKTVIDFSQLNQYEITQRIKNSNGSICARVTQKQLNTPLLDFEVPKKYNLPYSNLATGMMIATTMFTAGQPIQAHQKVQTEISQTNGKVSEVENNSESKPDLLKPDNFTIIKGIVKSDEYKKPIKNVKITLFTVNKNFSTYTSKDGTFSLKIPSELIDDDNVIRTSYDEIPLDNMPKKSIAFENTDYILTKKEINSVYKILAMPVILYLGEIGRYTETERIPIVLLNGKEIKYEDFSKAQEDKSNICNLENNNFYYFEPKVAIAIYGEKAKYGLYIINDKKAK